MDNLATFLSVLAQGLPETVGATIRDLLTSIHQLDDGLLLVLDAERTLSPTPAADWR